MKRPPRRYSSVGTNALEMLIREKISTWQLFEAFPLITEPTTVSSLLRAFLMKRKTEKESYFS
jgi:hypothetical protein